MRSPIKLFLLIYVILELLIFAAVCEITGVLMAVLLVVVSSIFGCGLLRMNGVETMYRAQTKMQNGESPGSELISGFAISFGAILLIIPGFLTSILGLLLVIPGCRRLLGGLFMRKNWFASRQQQWASQSANDENEHGRVIDGDYKKD